MLCFDMCDMILNDYIPLLSWFVVVFRIIIIIVIIFKKRY